MRVTVRFFAIARMLVGATEITLDLPERSTIATLRATLASATPGLSDILSRLMIAVNSEYADDSLVIPEGAEVAVIPPVSGGGHG